MIIESVPDNALFFPLPNGKLFGEFTQLFVTLNQKFTNYFTLKRKYFVAFISEMAKFYFLHPFLP